jgi:Amino acid permeases
MTPNTSRISQLPKTASLEGRRVLQRFGDPKRKNVRSFVMDPIVASRLSVKTSEDDLNDNLKLGDDGQAVCKQGMASATFNLVKANVGSGILALPVSNKKQSMINE